MSNPSAAPPSSQESQYQIPYDSNNTEGSLEQMQNQVAELEKEVEVMTSKLAFQNAQNCVEFEEFLAFKSKFEKASPLLEKLENASEAFKIGLLGSKILPENCEIKVNIRKAYESSQSTSEEASPNLSSCVSDEDDESHREKSFVITEIRWLKDRLLEISESLKMHSSCLKKLKCDEFARLKNEVEEAAVVLQEIKSQQADHQEVLRTIKCRDIVDIHRDIERVKTEVASLNFRLKNSDMKVEKLKNESDEKFRKIHQEIEKQISGRSWSRDTSMSDSSELMSVQNLRKSEEEKSQQSQSLESQSLASQIFLPKTESNNGSSQSECQQSVMMSRIVNESVKSYEIPMEGDNCYQTESVFMQHDQPRCEAESFRSLKAPLKDSQFPITPDCGMTANQFCTYMPSNAFGCPQICPDMSINLQEQVSSHGCCIQRLIHEVAIKVDRSELIAFSHQLAETADTVRHLRNQISLPTASLGVGPMMTNINCISCQTTTRTNMAIYANSIPRAPALKICRTGMDTDNSCGKTSNSSSKCGWTSYNRNGRRAGGSHTKIPKAAEIRSMRLRRLKTPVKGLSSILVYKNCFRKANCGC